MDYNNLDLKFMKLAIDAALDAKADGNDPFGAVLVKDSNVVAIQKNEVNTLNNPTAHAELFLLNNFFSNNSIERPWLKDYTMYASCEPCIMCSGAIHWARVGRLFYSISQEDLKSFSGGKSKPSSESLINCGNKKIEIIGGLLRDEGLKVFENFSFR